LAATVAGPAANVASTGGVRALAAAPKTSTAAARRDNHYAAPAPSPSVRLVRAGTSPVLGAAPAVAPLPAPLTWITTEHELTVGTMVRTYRLVRPVSTGGTKLPILVILHGREMTPAGAEDQTKFAAVVGPAILVYPAGYEQSWNAGACCGEAHAAGIDDVGFITDLVHTVLADQHDASGSVFLVGYSNGGRLAYRLACTEPHLFAAVATVEAASVFPCSKPAPVPLMMVASTDDPLLNVDGTKPPIVTNGYPQPSMTDLAASWANQEGCLTSVVRHPAPTVTTHTWQGCAMFSRIQLAVYQGGSHAWPDGDAHTPSAQRLIWRFFKPKSS
jgi:polyhydroxybutyrate depolymerase